MGQSVLSRIAREIGTPTYVYDVRAVRAQYGALDAALAGVPHRICYSVKANGNLGLLRVIRDLGAGADIVSGGELARALRAGFAPADVVFSGVGKTRPEIDAALEASVGLINVESGGELEVVGQAAQALGRVAPIGIRVNPDVTTNTHPYTQTGEKGMKFGVPMDEVVAVARRAAGQKSVELRSLGMHIGSQIADPSPYHEGARKLADLVTALRKTGIQTLQSVDVGGGLGISYGAEPGLTAGDFAAAVSFLPRATGLTLLTEPGRFLVGNAGSLLTRVLYRKHTGGREILVVDAGMNDLLRPSLYGAHHEMCVLETGSPVEAAQAPVDVVGPLCESGDFLGLERSLPNAGPGALLEIRDAGAYGFAMSSQYNARPRAAEVLVDGQRYAVARTRETVEDLMRGESPDLPWSAV